MEKVDYWLKRFELTDWANKKVEALSKGMSRKVQFIGTLEEIQSQYGSDKIRISTGDGLEALKDLPGILSVRDLGRMQELRMSADCDPQRVLGEIISRTNVKQFEIAKPSLGDIFVRIAGSEAEEANHV